MTNDEILLRLFEAIIKAAPHKSVEDIMHLWGEAAVFMGTAAYPAGGSVSAAEEPSARGVGDGKFVDDAVYKAMRSAAEKVD